MLVTVSFAPLWLARVLPLLEVRPEALVARCVDAVRWLVERLRCVEPFLLVDALRCVLRPLELEPRALELLAFELRAFELRAFERFRFEPWALDRWLVLRWPLERVAALVERPRVLPRLEDAR